MSEAKHWLVWLAVHTLRGVASHRYAVEAPDASLAVAEACAEARIAARANGYREVRTQLVSVRPNETPIAA